MMARSEALPLATSASQYPGCRGRELGAQLLDPFEAHEEGVVVVPHALRVVVDDHLDRGQLVLHLEDLVDLLLVLADDHAGLGVVDDVVHLRGDGVLVDGHGRPAQGLGRHHGPVELRAVVADDGDLVAAAEAQAGETQGDALDVVGVLAPRVGLPDPEFLLADGGAAVAPALGLGEQELRQGLGRGLHHAVVAQSGRRRPRPAARAAWSYTVPCPPTPLECVSMPLSQAFVRPPIWTSRECRSA